VVPLWKAVLLSADNEIEAECQDIPVSTSVHEDEQLEYGREGVPLCAMQHQCAALLYSGNQGPLHIYLHPDEQNAMWQTKHVVPTSVNNCRTCLLCLRRDVHGAILAWNAMVPNPQVQLRRSACMMPPFCNLLGVPGGYLHSAMAVVSCPGFGGASIVGVNGLIKINYNSTKKIFFFDQSAIKVQPRSFL